MKPTKQEMAIVDMAKHMHGWALYMVGVGWKGNE
jgi:hypothetical protein